jgi:hypothetical protein
MDVPSGSLMKDHGTHCSSDEELTSQNQGAPFGYHPLPASDRGDVDKVSIDMLPDEILLEMFDFYECEADDEEEWVTLVHVCQRWRAIVFAAPYRLNLRLLCTCRTPVYEMPDIWPALPIVVQMRGKNDEVDYNILEALEYRDHVCEIYVDDASNYELEELVEAMVATFPALTDLYLESTDSEAYFLPESFLGGSAPNLRSLSLRKVVFPALPNPLLSANHLIDLSLSHIPCFGFGHISSEAMADCLSFLTQLETLQIQFQYSRPRSRPTSASSSSDTHCPSHAQHACLQRES